jgi:hypothetical protein
MKLTLIGTTAALALSVFALPKAGAQAPNASGAPLYRIELIVFANRDLDGGEELFEQAREPARSSPTLPQRRERPAFDDTDLESLPDGATGPAANPNDAPTTSGASEPTQAERDALSLARFGFRLLRPDELELGSTLRTLERLQAYTPLLHGGWEQEARPEREAQPFDLAYLGRFNPRGTVRLHLSRFPHVNLDLSYQPDVAVGPSGSFGLSEIPLAPRYRLVEERRIPRNGELHYIDHPAFGVIVIIRPVERAAQPEATAGPAA